MACRRGSAGWATETAQRRGGGGGGSRAGPPPRPGPGVPGSCRRRIRRRARRGRTAGASPADAAIRDGGMSGDGGPRRLLIRDLAQLVTPAGRGAPLRGAELGRVDVLEDAFLLCDDGVVASLGRMRDLEALAPDVHELDGRGLCAVPGLVDCH